VSRRSEEPRAFKPRNKPKQESQDTRTLNELWTDSRWERTVPEQTDVYIQRNEPSVQTRLGRIVRTNQYDDMLYYK